MAKERDLAMHKYSISSNRYRELKYFCYQYADWNREIEALGQDIRPKGIAYDEVQGRTNKAGSPTEAVAVRIQTLEENVRMLEDAAKEASGDLWTYILLYVTNPDINFRYLEMVNGIPCSRRSFYNYRRKFFYYLDKKKDR